MTTMPMRIGGSVPMLLSFAFAWCAGCGPSGCGPKDEPADVVPPTVETYMAISGGGWRTHTAQAGWMIGLLDGSRAISPGSDVNLQTVLGDVAGIASNSGGSWFTTMLVYSDAFRAAIEAPNAIAKWGTSAGSPCQLAGGPYPNGGYLCQQQALLGGGPYAACNCSTKPCLSLAEAFSEKMELHVPSDLIWTDIVNQIVFKPFPSVLDDLSMVPLSAPRQSWAQDMSLILAATMLTDSVILTGEFNQVYYQAIPVNATVPQQFSVTPVSFSSLPSTSTLMPPDFFAVGDMDLTYKADDFYKNVPAKLLNQDVDSSLVLVTAAAGASSAAGGAEASVAVETQQGACAPGTDAYNASDLAPSFSISPHIVQMQVPSDGVPSSLAKGQFIRLADGGFLDNSAVAHLINFLQKNNKAKTATSFNIIAFENVQEVYHPSPQDPIPIQAVPSIPIDIAYLLGIGRPNNMQYCEDDRDPRSCVKVPTATIFTPERGEVRWIYPCPVDPINNTLTYTRYSVATVPNGTFNIAGGATGTLHVFASVWPKASTAPEYGDADFKEYNDLLACIHSGMTQGHARNGTHYFRMALQGG